MQVETIKLLLHLHYQLMITLFEEIRIFLNRQEFYEPKSEPKNSWNRCRQFSPFDLVACTKNGKHPSLCIKLFRNFVAEKLKDVA